MASAIFLLASREIRQQLRSGWFTGLFVLGLLTALLTSQIGALDYGRRVDDYTIYATRLEMDRDGGQRILTGTQVEPSLRVLREPVIGSIFVRGLDEVSPRYADVSPSGLKIAASAQAAATVYDAATTFDLAFVIRVVLGLLAIMLGVDMLARDRESGTLKVLLSLPCSPRWFVIGRLVGAATTLGAITMAVVAVSLVTVLAVAAPLFTWTVIIMALKLALTAFLYLLLLFTVGVMIGQISRDSSSASAIAVTVWLILTLLSGPAAAFVGRALCPVPSRELIEAQRDEMYASRLRLAQEAVGRRFRELSGPSATVRSVEFEDPLKSELKRAWEAELRAIRTDLRALEHTTSDLSIRQNRLIERLALASPGALFLSGAAAAAGTGSTAFTRWSRATENHQGRIERVLFDDPPRLYLRVPGPRGDALMFYDLRALPRVRDVPPFDAELTVATAGMLHERVPLVALLVYLLISLSAALVVAAHQPRPNPRAKNTRWEFG